MRRTMPHSTKKTYMKRLVCWLLPAVFCMSCGESRQPETSVLTVNDDTSFPKREICLQDIAEVEYVPLMTSDSVLLGDMLPESVSDEGIAVKGSQFKDIYLFDRTGQQLQGYINRCGQGPEEYTSIVSCIMDWQRREVFIADFTSLKVYGFDGTYRRTLLRDADMMALILHDLDSRHLLCARERKDATQPYRPYFRLSKEDGKADTLAMTVPRFLASNRKVLWDDGSMNMAYGFMPLLSGCEDRVWLTAVALDTVFRLHPDQKTEPVLVPRHAPTTDDEAPLLYFRGMSDRFVWLSWTPRNVTVRMSDMQAGIRERNPVYMYDRNSRTWCEPVYRNRDLATDTQDVSYIDLSSVPYGYALVLLNPANLVEAYRNGDIVGEKLKQIAATLAEDDNPVLMLLKMKN